MASDTGGVKPMAIAGRMVRERERLTGMTDEERAWRAQWIKDQELGPNEPRHVPELMQARLNPIRKFCRYPLDTLFKPLEPVLGEYRTGLTRYLTGRLLMAAFGVYTVFYYFKYHANDWTSRQGWRVIKNRKAVNIGDAEYPKLSERTLPSDYASRGFKDSPI